MKQKYEQLLAIYKEMQVVEQINMLLGWDQEVLMPKGGVIQRSEQQGYVAGLSHKVGTNPKIGKLLKEIKEHADFDKLSEIGKRNIYLIQREFEKATKLPRNFVVEYTKTQTMAVEAWREARAENDFSKFQPYLEKIFDMAKQYANFINPDIPPYEVLLDDFEPGMSSKKYTKIFTPLKEATHVMKLGQTCQRRSNRRLGGSPHMR